MMRLRITFSDAAMADTDERLFPFSRHRSKRIEKKLIKRHGGVFRKEPMIYKTPLGIVAHPSFKARIEAQTRKYELEQANAQTRMMKGGWY